MESTQIPVISVEQLHALIQNGNAPFILDVREGWEYALCHIANSVLIPLATLPTEYAVIPKDKPVVVMCHHGGRSANALMFLQQQGYTNVTNLTGGIHAWAQRIDCGMKTYT